jgi:hypothetical protein
MKVKVGKYINYIGPHQIAEKFLFWVKDDPVEDTLVDKFGEWLAGDDDHVTLLYKFCVWLETKRKQKIEVRIDPWDTWSMDHTLAPIILPMLIQLKANKHGSPITDDNDIPTDVVEMIQIGVDMKRILGGDDDYEYAAIHERWDYIMDAMIYSFDYVANHPEDWNDYSDIEEWKKNQERVQYGFTMFGRHFQALWD